MKKINVITLVSLIIVAVLFARYSLSQKVLEAPVIPIQDIVVHTSFSANVRQNAEPWVQVRGVGVGFVWPADRDKPPGERPQTEEVKLAAGAPFDPALILQMGEDETALVTVLLDLQQVPFELDGRLGLLHEITIESGVELEIPLWVDIPTPGVHELVVVVFTDPYNDSLDVQERLSMKEIGGRRVIVVSGASEKPAHVLTPLLSGHPIPGDYSGMGVAFITPPEKDKTPMERQLYVDQGKVGTPYDYQLWVSNRNGTSETDYAVVLFQDYHQVPVNGQDVTLVRLRPDEEIVINTTVTLPSTPGTSQMQLIYVLDPYRSILRDEVRSPFVHSSFRIAIYANE